MTKKLKTSKIFKGAIIGTAGLMCLSFTPVNALNVFADYYSGEHSIGSEVISINGSSDTISVGADYKVMKAYFGTDNKIELGLSDEAYDTALAGGGAYENFTGKGGLQIVDITSDISVTYSSGIDISENLRASTEPDVYKVFTADYIGEYKVSYSITIKYEDDSSKTYSTDLSVNTEASSAYMMFEDESFIMPTTYYKDLAKAKNNNQLLPIRVMVPNVYLEDEEDPIEFTDAQIVTSKDEARALPTKGLAITANNITVHKEDGKFFIQKEDVANAVNGNNIIVTYTYYNAGSFVMSTSKTITVYEEYDNGDTEYKLTASLASTLTASTKVAVKLPTVNAYATESSTEKVSVKTVATAYKKNASGYYTETQDGSIADGKFTAWADGDYKIVFKVTDFYGNEAEVTTLVTGVKDTKAPEVTMYDAGDDANDRANGEFVSAETKLKTSAVQKNIVIYAIGATDNVTGVENLIYQRTIKSSARTFEIKSYNKYNLIFDFDFDTFLGQNYVIKKQMEADFATSAGDLDNADDVKTWLKEHNYLIVTSTPKDNYTEADYIADGEAYLDIDYTTMISGSSSGTSYTVTYIAKDNAGNSNSSLYYTFKVFDNAENFTDATAPTISISSSFKNNYSSTDKITFSAPVIKDEDEYVEKSISYAYYNGVTKIDDKDFTFTDEDYTINIKKDIATFSNLAPEAEKIILTITAVDDYGNEGIYTKEFKIIDVLDSVAPTIFRENYNTENTGATQNEKITLPTIVYTDDYAGYMTSEVKVYHLKSVNNQIVKTAVEANGKNASSKNNLYTLNAGSFVASFAGEYEVVVTTKDKGGNVVVSYYHYDVDAKNEISRPYINSTLSKETKVETNEELSLPIPVVNYAIDDDFDIYGVSEDSTNSATNYEVVVKYANADYDLLNNEIFIGHSYLQAGKYQLAYQINLQVFKNGFGFVKESDGVTLTIAAEKYYMTRIKANVSDADEHTGNYILYSKNANGTIKNIIYGEVDGTSITFYDLAAKLDGPAYITVGGINYYAQIEDEGLVFVSNFGNTANYLSATVEGATLKFTSHGTVGAVADKALTVTVDVEDGDSNALTTKDFVEITQTTDTYTITVSDTVAPSLNGANYEYSQTAEKGSTIYIQPNKSVENSNYAGAGIDEEKSYVELAFKGRTKNEETGATSSYSQSYSVKLKDWTNPTNSAFPGTYISDTTDDNFGSISYTLSATNNGTYTISYYIFDKAGNQQSLVLNETKFEIKVGDTVSPTLKLAKDFLDETYKVGDTITLDMSKLTMSDNVTTDVNDLMKTLKVKVTNTTTNEEVDNALDGVVEINGNYEGFFEYKITEVGTYKIEVEVTDDAGLTTTKSIEFEVTESETNANVVSTVVGIVLVIAAVAILAGVIIYFVVSKVKLDKELGSKKKK